MTTTLLVTYVANIDGTPVSISSQTINFVTRQAAEKALDLIKANNELVHGASVFVDGVILGDVII